MHPTEAAAQGGSRWTAPCCIAMLVGSTLFQRLAVPLGEQQLSLTIPFVLAMLAVGLVSGEFRVEAARLRVFALMAAVAVACTIGHLVLGGAPSLLSVVLFLALYALVGVSADLTAQGLATVERVFLGLMTIAAVVSIGQMVAQLTGVPYEDYLAGIVPADLLLEGYNTADPIAYGDPLYRSNGIVFLEPSFLSLFLGLAVALALYRGAGVLQVTVLLVGMVPPLAGSGFVVLVPALVLMLFGAQRRHLVAALPAIAIALVVATLTPLGERYLERSTEASDPRTSSSARLVQPYELLLPPAVEDTPRAIVGHGAGAADDYLIDIGKLDATAPVVPKVLYEYGILGLLGILLPLVLFLGGGAVPRPWTIGLLVAYLYVNASFLQSTQVFLTLFWMTLLPAHRYSWRRTQPPALPDRVKGAEDHGHPSTAHDSLRR
ncbi:hypothetical protein [Trujillonella endophytica]|uniref:O-antigen ligase like membrane protein n=1 Tax=Trujillonella endophytica TaxID=673521 RepID=A0A1H8W1G3_9ACTN|nr:hypothetical protein [Trujillella endophytica]SEP21363.1 hypothetical protein SAMN05660991_03958 [Trujillella endophytica]